MSKLLIALVLSFAVSAVEADYLLGVWHSPILGEEDQAVTLTFRSDNTCEIKATVPEAERLGLFAELFENILHDLNLTVADLQELGFKIPVITQIRMEGSYTVENDSLTVYLTQFLLKVEDDQYLELGQLIADVARQLVNLLNKETTDLELIAMLTVLAETGPLITDLIIEAMMEEEPFIASGFSIQGDRLQFQESEFAGVIFVRQDGATSIKTTSWGQIKGKISN